MPFRMGGSVQSVVLGNKVYVGGGLAHSDRDMCTVMVYDLQRDKYSTLPRYNTYWFAMSTLNNQLVLVGGTDSTTRKPTNGVAVFDSKKWVRPYPTMNIARCKSTAISFNSRVIVAGGRDDENRQISSVEVLDVASNRWFIAQPLPGARAVMKSNEAWDMCYLMGGFDDISSTRAVHRVNSRELSEKAFSMAMCQGAPNTTALWQTVEDTPLFHSAPVVLKGSLLAVGGCDERNHTHTSIHLYQPDSMRWVKVGDLPIAQCYCTCSVLPNGEVFVAGGGDRPLSCLSRVDFLTVTESS